MINEKMVNLILGGAVAIGFVWTQLKSLPRMEERITTHEVKVAVIEAKLGAIEEGVKFLVREKRSSRRSSGD